MLKTGDFVKIKDTTSPFYDTYLEVYAIQPGENRVIVRGALDDRNSLHSFDFKNVEFNEKANLEYGKDNKAPEYESVNHPTHYHPGDYEAIKVIRAWLGDEGCYYFCLGNTIKYISRLDKKPSADKSKDKKTIEDIDKAVWYLNYAKEIKSEMQ